MRRNKIIGAGCVLAAVSGGFMGYVGSVERCLCGWIRHRQIIGDFSGAPDPLAAETAVFPTPVGYPALRKHPEAFERRCSRFHQRCRTSRVGSPHSLQSGRMVVIRDLPPLNNRFGPRAWRAAHQWRHSLRAQIRPGAKSLQAARPQRPFSSGVGDGPCRHRTHRHRPNTLRPWR
jgi:hypothetical protein